MNKGLNQLLMVTTPHMKNQIRTLLSGNDITTGNGHLLLIPIQSELASFAS